MKTINRRLFIGGGALAAGAVGSVAISAYASDTFDKQGVPFYLVDAFTIQPFSGNPAPVVFLTKWLPDAAMQALAREMNMSEVAYVIRDNNRCKIRWFTPAKEVELNGHATLAASSVIFERLDQKLKEITFTSKGGELRVGRDGEAYLMNFPADVPPVQVEIPREAEADLGIKPSEYWVNKRNIAVFRTAAEVAEVKSKVTKATEWTQGRHLMITAPGDGDVDYVLRYFVPLLDIPEDPVSGVVHCTLAPFWAERTGKRSFNVLQLSARGGRARTGVQPDGRVLIGGPCVTYVEGRLLV